VAGRLLLLMPTTTYKADDFLEAASRLGVEVLVGTDRPQALAKEAPGRTLDLDLSRPERGVADIVAFAADRPISAVVGTDDETVTVAAMAAEALGLRHNTVESTRAARDKFLTRQLLAAAGMRTPSFRLVSIEDEPSEVARDLSYPCVLKTRFLSASRGVMRADDPASFVAAFARVAAILREPDVVERGGEAARHVLVERYLPGVEVALEGLLDRGELRVLALFDKPDPLVGPVFEETIYVTPSRLPRSVQSAIARETSEGCRALGLREGPVHAELRVEKGEPSILEVAARTIGGLCSRTLRFGAGVSLEELILRHALGMDTSSLAREGGAAGVMMIPIPRAGVLREVQGAEAARAVDGIEDVRILVPLGDRIVPLPEGHRYLGFVFARGERSEIVESALREAHARMRFVIEP